jgi:hypothetical protein
LEGYQALVRWRKEHAITGLYVVPYDVETEVGATKAFPLRRPPARPRGHAEQITVDGEVEPAIVKLGVWVSNTKSRRDKLTAEQLAALHEIGVEWA